MALSNSTNNLPVLCLKEILEGFQDLNLPVVLLRPKQIDEHHCFEGDYDFLVQKNAFKDVLAVIHKTCKDNGVHFELIQSYLYKTVVKIFYERDGKPVTLEFWPHVELSVDIFSVKTWSRVKAEALFNLPLMHKNQTALLGLIYITHLYHKHKDIRSEENKWRFTQFTTELKNNSDDISKRLIELLNSISSGKTSLRQANAESLLLLKKAGVTQHPLRANLARITKKITGKARLSTNRIIPVLGPDGSGKGVIQNAVLEDQPANSAHIRFKELYRVYPFYNARIRLIKNRKTQPYNQLDESMLNYIFWISLFSLTVLLLRTRSKTIIMDRYFTDYFAGPIRYLAENKPEPVFFYRLYLVLAPTPGKLAVLGCKDETLKQRKNELTDIAVRTLESLTYDFVTKKRVPYSLFLSTERPINETTEIFRLKLPHDRNRL